MVWCGVVWCGIYWYVSLFLLLHVSWTGAFGQVTLDPTVDPALGGDFEQVFSHALSRGNESQVDLLFQGKLA